MTPYLPLAAAISTLLATGLPTVASAQTERDLDSHVHGSATLNVALDGNALYLELESPWDNLVGFEHVPSTDEQQALVDDARDLLSQPEQMFTLDGGGCSAGEMQMESGLQDAAHGNEHEGTEEEAHHDDEHAHEDEDEDAHHDDEHAHEDEEAHHDDEHDDESSHAAASMTYTYECAEPAQLSSIDVRIFSLWDGFEDLDVQLIGPSGQAAQELGPQQHVVDITQVQ